MVNLVTKRSVGSDLAAARTENVAMLRLAVTMSRDPLTDQKLEQLVADQADWCLLAAAARTPRMALRGPHVKIG